VDNVGKKFIRSLSKRAHYPNIVPPDCSCNCLETESERVALRSQSFMTLRDVFNQFDQFFDDESADKKRRHEQSAFLQSPQCFFHDGPDVQDE
jgi:hypothetical protein